MTDQRIPLSPERAAKRAKERADLTLIGQIAVRFLQTQEAARLLEAKPNRGLREDITVKLIQVNGANPGLLDLAALAAAPEDVLSADIRGLFLSTTLSTGQFNDTWRPRSVL